MQFRSEKAANYPPKSAPQERKAPRHPLPLRQNAEQHPHPLLLRQSLAPECIAPPPPPPQRSGGGTKGYPRIQGGSRGNSQSPYPSLAAGGSHAAAAAAKSGARMRRTARNATEERKHIRLSKAAPKSNLARNAKTIRKKRGRGKLPRLFCCLSHQLYFGSQSPCASIRSSHIATMSSIDSSAAVCGSIMAA